MEELFAALRDHFAVTLRPPADASPATIRKAGAFTAAVGLGVLALAVIVMALLGSRVGRPQLTAELASPLWGAGLFGIIMGSFRLVLASEPDGMSPVKRMTLGVLFGCGGLVLLAVLALLVAVLLDG